MERDVKKEFSIEYFVTHRKVDLGILFSGVLLGIFFGWNVVEIVIFLIFIWALIGPIVSRYLVWPALFFLSFTPILLSLGRKEQAEEYAIYAYYFFVMIVIRGIIELRAEKEGNTEEKPI